VTFFSVCACKFRLRGLVADRVLGDSRTPHYNVPVKGTQDRLAVYTCYMPVADASQGDLKRKKVAFQGKSWYDYRPLVVSAKPTLLLDKVGTTHWPNALHTGTNVAKRNGEPDKVSRDKPLNEPKLSERAFRLTGIPYIRVGA
jgi:hypothetical protein